MAPIKNTVQVHCRNCQAGNQPGSPHCNSCGAPLADVAQDQASSQVAHVAQAVPVGDPAVRFSGDGQDRAMVKQTYERAKAILTQDESIEYIATAKGGIGHAPNCAVATDKRVMLFRKKALGKVELDDCWWRDVGSASFVETKNGVNLKLDAIQGWHMTIENLPRIQADAIYNLAFTYADHLRGQSQPLGVHQQTSGLAPSTFTTPRLATHPSLPNLGAAPIITSSGLSSSFLSNSTHGLDSSPLQSQASAQPAPAFIPTPESVLQSILQNSALAELEEHGVPTRPMQWSAAAFQAPAIAEVQPVMLTGNNPNQPDQYNHSTHLNNSTDTEPQIRLLPPLTTLERIAVFTPPSGPLSLESTPRLSLDSMPLGSTPVLESGALQSSPIDAASLLGQWSDTASLQLPSLQDEPYPQITDLVQARSSLEDYANDLQEDKWSVEVDATPRVAQTTQPIFSGPLNAVLASGVLPEVVPTEVQTAPAETEMAWPELEPEPEQLSVPVAPAPDQMQQAGIEVEAQSEVEAAMPALVFDDHLESGPLYDVTSSSIRPTAPMGAEDYELPMPGSTSSGPLLAAAGDMDDDIEDMYRNTSPMATQRLDYQSQTEDPELATRINLTLHNTPPNQMSPSRGSGSSSRTNTDELKSTRASGSRTAGSGRTKADDPIAKMKQLKSLLDAGLITEEDYASKKSDILSRI